MRGFIPVIAGIVFLPCLSSCTVTTDRMRFHFDDERRGSFSIAASVHIGKPKGGDKGDFFHAKKSPIEQSIEDKMKACGLSGLTFRADEEEHINARASFNYPDELETSLACIPSGWDVVRVQSKRDEGLLRYTYVTTIRLEQPRVTVNFSEPTKDVGIAGIGTFPRELSVTVPGTISDVRSDTDILGAIFKADNYGTQEVRATLTEAPDSDTLTSDLEKKVQNAVARGRIDQTNLSRLSRNVYAVTVTSHQWRVHLEDILSIAGVLFGSGFVLQFVRSRAPGVKRRRQAAA
jgi:hypothetical protein